MLQKVKFFFMIIGLIFIFVFSSYFEFAIPVTGNTETQSMEILEIGDLKLQLSDDIEFFIASQPDKNIGYVSSMLGVVTRFQQAESLGSIGLIAHNYLSGKEFFHLEVGDTVQIANEENNISQTYRVSEIKTYQALQPTSIHSQFKDLESGDILTANNLSRMIYNRPGQMILQTCIENGGNYEWGRIFIIAEPISAI